MYLATECADGITRTCAGQWNAYVASGRTREQRRARLMEVPEVMREAVRGHVVTVFGVRRKMASPIRHKSS